MREVRTKFEHNPEKRNSLLAYIRQRQVYYGCRDYREVNRTKIVFVVNFKIKEVRLDDINISNKKLFGIFLKFFSDVCLDDMNIGVSSAIDKKIILGHFCHF